jgi:hypothetical protein
MTNKASPTPKTRKRTRPKGQDRPSWAGNLKMCYSYKNSPENIRTMWCDKRWKGDFDKELNQLYAARDRCERQPASSGIAWAEVYDCTQHHRGPVICTWKEGAWHTAGN